MKKRNWKRFFHISIVLLCLAIATGLGFFILKVSGIWDKINSVDKLQQSILKLGFWGRFAFVLLQFLQVTFIPLPSPIIVGAGALIYGPFQSGLLSLAGILLGSSFAFFLGRVFGKSIVSFMVGDELCVKWQNFLNKFKYSFILMMLLPLFPDDVLCLVAGITNMSWMFFMTTQLITRPIGVFLVSFFSSGQIIPYHGWGLIVWAIFLIASVALIYLASRYRDKIECIINKVFTKKGR